MSKYSRSGGKFGGKHTTLIPIAAKVADIAHNCEFVTKISPGYIKSGLKSLRGRKSVKISTDKIILLAVRDNTSHQEVRVYTKDIKATTEAIAQGSAAAGLVVKFLEKS